VIGAGRFDAYAVGTGQGPHVTLQAGVVHLGRHWTTTTRRSVKVAAIRRTGTASATTGDGPRWRVVSGPASTLDPTHPASLAAHPVSSALSGGALLRLGLGRLDQLLGYAEAGTAVPLSFLPTGRVLLVTRIQDELTLEGDDVVDASGRWARSAGAIEPSRGLRRPWNPDRALAGVPDDLADLVAQAGRGWLGVRTARGSVALPGEWDPSTGQLRVSHGALAAVQAELPAAICVTLHDSGSRRPDQKLGVMLRGTGAVADVDRSSASVAIAVERVTYWDGFVSNTKAEVAA
jgi:hypothetical protein